jgi:hypothetical protein
VKAHEAEKLIATIRQFIEPTGNHANSPDSRAGSQKVTHPSMPVATGVQVRGNVPAGEPQPGAVERINADQVEKLYQQIKNRLLDDLRVDPVFVQILANVSEIVVELTPRVVTLEGDSLKGRVARLIAGGFFNEPKRQGAARSELVRTGPDCNSGNLSRAMTEFVADGFLTRDGESFVKAPGVKVTEKLIGVNV